MESRKEWLEVPVAVTARAEDGSLTLTGKTRLAGGRWAVSGIGLTQEQPAEPPWKVYDDCDPCTIVFDVDGIIQTEPFVGHVYIEGAAVADVAFERSGF